MKHIYFSLLCISLFCGALFLVKKQAHFRPMPTERNEKQGEGKKKEAARQAYIAHIHRTAPNVNWQAVEMENRILRMKQRFAALQSKDRSTADTIAQDIIGTWKEVGSNNVAGRVIYADWWQPTGEVYAAADGGSIWRGKDDGSQWQLMNNLFELDEVIYLKVLPKNGNKRIMAVSQKNLTYGFFYTDNEGQTWENPTGTGYNTIVAYGRIYECMVTNDALHTIYLVASDSVGNALYKSEDLGNTFSRVLKLPSGVYGSGAQISLFSDKDGSGTLYLLGKNKCYKLENNSFTLLGTIPTSSSLNNVLCGAEINGTTYLYARFEDNLTGDNLFFASSNGGVTWQNKGTLPDGMFMRNSFHCSSITPNLIYLGNIEVHKSTNAGTSFNTLSDWWEYYDFPASKLHADIPSVHTFATGANSELTIFCTDGGIFTSTNQGQTVKNITMEGLRNSQYYSTYTHRTNLNYLFAGSQDQGFQRSTIDNGGIRDFDQLISGDYGHICSGNGGNTIWTNYPGSTMVYANYTSANNSAWLDFPFSNGLWLAPLMADPNSPTKAFLAGGTNTGSGAYMYHLSYANGDITATELPYNFGAAISALAYSPANTNYRYVINDNAEFFASNNAGSTWFDKGLNGLPSGQYFYGNALLCSPISANRVYVGGSGYGMPAVYMSKNGGNDFEAMSDSLPNTLVYGLACTPDESLIFAATESGPYVYKTADSTWYYLGATSAPDELYWSVEYLPQIHTVRFGTYGRGIWDFVLDNTMFVSNENEIKPTNVKIYPNPASEQITITFEDAKLQNGLFSLQNATGQIVKQQKINAFDNTLNIEGLDCGLYLLQVISQKGELIETKKVVIH